MSQTPEHLSYADTHEWVLDHGDGTITVGITDHAQAALGDVVFIELPAPGKALARGEVFGVIESVKAASELYAPCDGEVIEANTSLEDDPEVVNEAPYEGGWMIKLRKHKDPEDLLDDKAYQASIGAS